MLKSIFLGYDDNEKELFENTRTEIGELVYKLKYQKDKKCLNEIMNLIKEILDKWNLREKVDFIIPVPPSNRKRKYQPVSEIAKEIANYLGKECRCNVLNKISDFQVKDGHNVKGTIKQISELQMSGNVLVVDDLFSTGATLNEVCKVLKNDKNINKVYCLVLTKTKR